MNENVSPPRNESRMAWVKTGKPQLVGDVRGAFLNATCDLRIERLAIESMPGD